MNGKLKSSLFAGAVALLSLFPCVKESGLKEIANPSLGVYECTRATLGSSDLLARFTTLRLELLDKENFALCYQEKGGARKRVEGKYAYDEKTGTLTFLDEKGGIKREFPFAEGKISLSFSVGGRQCVLRFERE